MNRVDVVGRTGSFGGSAIPSRRVVPRAAIRPSTMDDDLTYAPTRAGFLCPAVVLDAFSRRIVGWAVGTIQRTRLVPDAQNMALGQRRPAGAICRSDQGSPDISAAFGLRCKQAPVRPSMGSVGEAYDNAMCGSFFATLECERLDRREVATGAEACMAVFDVIECRYGPGRRHSALGYLLTIDCEMNALARLEISSP